MASRTEAGRVRTDPRISRRRKAVAKSKKRRVIGSVLALVVLVVAIWGAFWSPLLNVRRIQVTGAERTDPDEVRTATGLGSDENLLLLSTGEVASEVETLPWVKDAEVHRRLPATVRIKIQERTPVLVVTVAAGSWTIDASGHVLQEGATSKELPTLTGAVLSRLEPGERVAAQQVRSGLAVWRSLPRKVKPRVASVVAASRERIALALDDGTIVRYGGAERLVAKNKVLNALLARLAAEGRKATYLDVSVPSTPAVGPAPAAVTPAPGAVSPAPTPPA